MTQRQSFGVLIAHALIAMALIGAAASLGAIGVLDAAAVTGIFGAVLGFAGGAGISQGAAIINGGPKPDYGKLAQADPQVFAQNLAAARGERRETPQEPPTPPVGYGDHRGGDVQ